MRIFCILFTGLAAFGPTPVVLAQNSARDGDDDVIELATLEVTAHPTGADERTAAVWVEQPHAAATPTTTADLLAGVPGLNLDRAGGAGGRSTLYLRGGEENHTLVLLDGVPLNDPTNSRGGGVDFSLLDPAAIASAAIVRGPGSMRHGPEAISGVIHLDTVAAAATQHAGAAEGGGDGLGRASFRSTLPAGSPESRFTLGGAWHTEDAAEEAGRLDRLFLHGDYQSHGVLDLAVRAWHLDQVSEAFPDDSGGTRYAVIRALERRDDRQSAAALHLGQRTDHGSWAITADAALLESHVVSPGVAPGLRDPVGLPASDDDIRLERYRVALLLERRAEDWTLSGGMDIAREEGRDDALLDFGFFQMPAGFRQTRDRFGGFLEAVGPVGEAITVSAGVRADRFDDVGTHATGRLGLLGTINATTLWRVNGGSGFKAPSFYALAHPLVGNPDLKPERGRSIDAGLRHTFADGRGLVDLSLFANTLHNGVDFDPGPPPRMANRAESQSRGAEMALLWHASRQLELSGALTYTDARDRSDDSRLRSRPRWRGSLALAWTPLSAVTIEGRLVAVDAVPDSSIPTGDIMLPGWGRLDLAVRWGLHEHWSVTVACDNALDHEYEEIVGFTAPGRRLRLGVQARF